MQESFVLLVLSCFAIISPASACPDSQAEACQEMRRLSIDLALAKSNINNVNTTRTPEGGPYKPVRQQCNDAGCDVVEMKNNPLFKYEPDHPDANRDGYVIYPGLDLLDEMRKYLVHEKAYAAAEKRCFEQKN